MAATGLRSKHRVYRTAGGRLCLEGDPQAAFLAYPVGAIIPLQDVDAYHALVAPAAHAEVEAKAAPKSANKQASKPANK